jgi:hypothetical protein
MFVLFLITDLFLIDYCLAAVRMAGRALAVPGSCGEGELLTAECSWTCECDTGAV